MNRLNCTVILCVLLCWSTLGFSAEKLSVTVDADASQFTVSLPANPTTGFKWVVSKYDTTHFNYLSSEYVATLPARIGSGGHSVFHFSRKSGVKYPRTSHMLFHYARAWEAKSGTDMDVTIYFLSASK